MSAAQGVDLGIERGIAAQHQHVDLGDVDRLGLVRDRLHRREEGRMVLVLLLRREAGVDRHRYRPARSAKSDGVR